MPRLPVVSVLFLALVGCGGGGGLLATVPPPVEFAGARVNGLKELPAAGTYTGTVVVDRTTYRYNADAVGGGGNWSLFDAQTVADSVPATATVGADGSISLRRTSDGQAIFTGTLKVDTTDGVANPTTATLAFLNNAPVTYPYVLQEGTPRSLFLKVHGMVSKRGQTQETYDQYTFELQGPVVQTN